MRSSVFLADSAGNGRASRRQIFGLTSSVFGCRGALAAQVTNVLGAQVLHRISKAAPAAVRLGSVHVHQEPAQASKSDRNSPMLARALHSTSDVATARSQTFSQRGAIAVPFVAQAAPTRAQVSMHLVVINGTTSFLHAHSRHCAEYKCVPQSWLYFLHFGLQFSVKHEARGSKDV